MTEQLAREREIKEPSHPTNKLPLISKLALMGTGIFLAGGTAALGTGLYKMETKPSPTRQTIEKQTFGSDEALVTAGFASMTILTALSYGTFVVTFKEGYES